MNWPSLAVAPSGTQIDVAYPGAAIVGVWLYCLLWLVIADALKLVYWRLAERDEGRRPI